ncbi:MAG: Crp/Fnr family transcriptional regulator [Hyphomicrobiaceae bacterium]|nr:Crp/Fnr family transcriptional regulator [Hyphomicrobiaceae bacterium]
MPQPPPRRPQPTPCPRCTLKNNKCFRPLEESELRFLNKFKTGELVTEAGAAILLEGSNSPHLYTVLSGWAFRYKTLPDGRRQILNFALPGDFLGLQSSLFSEMQHSVESLTQMVLCVFPRERLWELYSEYPALAFDLTWLVAQSERVLDESLLSVGRRSALERIAFILLYLHNRAYVLGLTQGKRMKAPFTQQHIADALGLSLVHTNKTLKVLADRKCIRWKDGVLELLDDAKLMEIAGYNEPRDRLLPIL